MIFTGITGTQAYRLHTPKWAVLPLSGDGAAQHGGRLNRPGISTLYLSLDANTAIQEYKQTSPLLPPGTLVSYVLNLGKVVDFSDGFHGDEWSPIWQDFYCDWRELWFGQQIEPPSWVIADAVIASDATGVLFPSQMHPGGYNLALYMNELGSADSVEVVDPGHELPKNQKSWL